MRSILDPPGRHAIARFRPGFAPRFMLTVETGLDAGRRGPLSQETHGPDHLRGLQTFQDFCTKEEVAPIYLLDWPIANSPHAAEILRGPLARGEAEIGVQFHPGAEFARLRNAIESNFGCEPLISRAGRYGPCHVTAQLPVAHGPAIDSSVRPHFDFSSAGGPDYRRFPLVPYWVDDERTLLELPVTAIFWGLLRKQGPWIYPRAARARAMRTMLASFGLLQRIALDPEGVSVEEAICGIDIAIDDGLPLLVFSFTSCSLIAGRTSNMCSDGDLDELYDWWRRVFAYLQLRGIAPARAKDVMSAVIR